MLKQETIQKIETLLKIKGLSDAIKSETEVDVEITELTLVTDDDLTKIKNEEYKNGKEKGLEMAVKETKEKLGLTFQGKTIEGLVEAAQKKALEDAKVSPDKKVAELEKDNQTLRTQIEELTGKVTEKETEAIRAKTDRLLFKEVPETTLSSEDLLDFARLKGYDFRLDDKGQIVPFKNGEPIKDKVANVRSAKEVLTEFATEFKLIKEATPGARGRGEGDQTPPTKAATLSELKKQFESQGKSVLGAEFMTAAQQAAKDNPEFKMDA